MIIKRNEKIAVIHVAKKACGLDDGSYRALLRGAAGIGSCAELSEEHQFEAIMGAFKKLGHAPLENGGRKRDREWGCSRAQRTYIEHLWRSVSRNKDGRSLRAFIKRTTGCDHPRFLSRHKATQVIVALKKIWGSA